MRAVFVTLVVLVVFWIYWFVPAMTAKSGSGRWGSAHAREGGAAFPPRPEGRGIHAAIPMTDEVAEAKRELVAANRILGREGILDAFGHVSVRHPADPARFLLSRARSPENVEVPDVLEFDAQGEVVADTGAIPYLERFIHAGVYEARPDVTAVCHNHAVSILPFSISRSVKLRATINASRMFGDGIPVWDIADDFGDSTDMLVRNMTQGRSLARVLGAGPVALMRGHGSVVAAAGLRQVVYRCLDMDRGARAQLAVMTLGETRSFTDAEIAPHADLPPGATRDDRAWEYLLHRAGLGLS